MSGGQI